MDNWCNGYYESTFQTTYQSDYNNGSGSRQYVADDSSGQRDRGRLEKEKGRLRNHGEFGDHMAKERKKQRSHGNNRERLKIEKVGLRNYGNYCYMNSAIQALYACASFREWMLATEFNPDATVTLELQKLFRQLHSHQVEYADARHFAEVARPVWFEERSQQDCSDFLRHVLFTMDNEISKRQRGHSKIKDFFEIKTTNSYQCQKCKTVQKVQEGIFDLLQPLPEEKKYDDYHLVSLESLLYRSDQVLNSHCAQCRKDTALNNRIKFEWPPYVIFNIPRGKDGCYGTKRNIRLKYPETLQRKEMPGNYRLISVISHLGVTAKVGHYVCYCMHTDGEWYKCDDSAVTKIYHMQYEDSRDLYEGATTLIYYRGEKPTQARFSDFPNRNATDNGHNRRSRDTASGSRAESHQHDDTDDPKNRNKASKKDKDMIF